MADTLYLPAAGATPAHALTGPAKVQQTANLVPGLPAQLDLSSGDSTIGPGPVQQKDKGVSLNYGGYKYM